MFVVYQITNIKNKKIYIGSTNNFFYRRLKHIESLELNNHHNYRLQNDWNVFGRDCFTFEIIARGFETKDKMLIREYELINRFKNIAYNIDMDCPVVSNKKKKNRLKKKERRKVRIAKKLTRTKAKALLRKKKARNVPSIDSLLERKRLRDLKQNDTRFRNIL